MVSIGRNIKKAREHLGLSQGELAQRSGLAPSTISDLENERQKTTTKIHRVAQALGMTAHDLERGVLPGAQAESVAMAYLSEREEELLRLFRSASPAVKRAIEGAAGKGPEQPEEPPDRPSRRT